MFEVEPNILTQHNTDTTMNGDEFFDGDLMEEFLGESPTEEGVDRRRTGNKNYALKTVQERHQEIIRLVAIGRLSNEEIASVVGVTPQTVSNVRNSRLAKSKIKIITKARDIGAMDVRKDLDGLEPLAVQTLRDCMESPDAPFNVKSRVALGVISDIGGYGKGGKRGRRSTTVVAQYIEEVVQSAREQGILAENQEVQVESA